ARRFGREEGNICFAADGKDFIARNGNGDMPVPLAIHRVDSATAQHDIGAHKGCRSLLSQKEETEEGEAQDATHRLFRLAINALSLLQGAFARIRYCVQYFLT
ncbi:MAG: hypothetical protein VXY63_09350, partial [Pseudomonadota bacterium]|nr:hypothetical protein [Pseudomonadota bacterium]